MDFLRLVAALTFSAHLIPTKKTNEKGGFREVGSKDLGVSMRGSRHLALRPKCATNDV